MLRIFSGFFLIQIIKPLGILIQFSLLARFLGVSGMAVFLPLFAAGILLSAFSDLGQRQLAFGTFRSADSHAEKLQIWNRAFRIKVFSTFIFIAIAICALFIKQDKIPIILATTLLAISAPISDISLAILRGASKPFYESLASAIEQSLILLCLVTLHVLGFIDPLTALLTYGIIGSVRMVVMFFIVSGILEKPKLSMPLLAEFKKPAETAISILSSNGFVRLPVLVLPLHMEAGSYAVFSTFWLLLLRGELILAAIIQTSFNSKNKKWSAITGKPELIVSISIIYGLIIFCAFSVLSAFATSIFMGQDYISEHKFAALAAMAIIFLYPVFCLRSLLQYRGKPLSVTLTFLASILFFWSCSHFFNFQGKTLVYIFAGTSIVALTILFLSFPGKILGGIEKSNATK